MGKREKKRLKHKSERVPGACLYCNSNEDNELKYGKLIYNEKKKIRVHHYCLLFASGLCQRGQENDDKGIEGFLIPDILEEYKRGARLRCVYCKQSRATVGCVIKSCRSMYHFGCGVENRALFLFYDNFISYCQVHRPQQDEPELPSESPTSTCPICLESVEAKVSDDTLRTPCCTNSWFHRICVQRQALSAGYFFRCGICNNKEDFQREMKQFGIYIPEQDAAWELEDNAYQELYQRHNQCDIEPCICPKGRKYHPSRGQWEVVLCDTCGSRGCHLTCGGLANQWDDWVCDQCEEVVDKSDVDSEVFFRSTSRSSANHAMARPRAMTTSPTDLTITRNYAAGTRSCQVTDVAPPSTSSTQSLTPQGSNCRRRRGRPSHGQRRERNAADAMSSLANASQELEAGQTVLAGIEGMLQTALKKPLSEVLKAVHDIQRSVVQINQTTVNLQKDITQLKAEVSAISVRQFAIVDQQRRSRNLMKRIWELEQDEVPLQDVKRQRKNRTCREIKT